MRLLARIRRLLGFSRDFDEEIHAHLAMAVRDRIEKGEGASDALRNASSELGNVTRIKSVTRQTWGWTALESVALNLTYAFRRIQRSPGFAIAAVLTLALGLGATTVMFSFVNGVLLEPLKFPDSHRLYVARTLPPANAGMAGDFPVNARQYYEWVARCRSCRSVSLIQFQHLTVVGSGRPAKLPALEVSFNFFRTLGVQPALGRDFLPQEDAPGHAGEVILSDGLWQSRYSGDPSILGRSIQLNGEAYTVVGVMPASFHLPKGDEWGKFFGPADTPVIFRPLGIDASNTDPVGNLNYTSIIRLKNGVRAQQAIAELNALLADFARRLHLQTRITLIPFQQEITRSVQPALWLLLATVAAVLLIACVNVGNLMLVRTISRYREASVRLALGASRGQLFNLVLTEALVLVAMGGCIGLGLSYLASRIVVAAAPAGLPRIEDVQVDWRVLAFSALLIVFSAFACGLFPAWRLAGTNLLNSLGAGARTVTGGAGKLSVREFLTGAQVALSTVLLIAGGLLMLSFFRVMRVEKGFEVAHIVTQDVSYLSPKYARGARRRIVEETVAKLGRIPGVEFAAAINRLPLRGDDWVSELEDPARPTVPGERPELANFRFVTPDYWRVMGIPLKAGRFLDASDKNESTAVISERAARFLWPNRNPLGQKVLGAGNPGPALRVVGVVGEVRASGLDRDPPMIVYEHYWRMQPIAMSFVLRTRIGPSIVAGALRSLLSSADPEMAISQPAAMEQIIGDSVAARRFQVDLTVGFAFSALLLASLGVYGVISFSVARRIPEIGIRIPLGAQPPRLAAMILWRGMRPVLVGLAVGIAGAMAVGRWLASQLFEVAPSDPLILLTVVALLLLVAALACWLPAWRAAHVDPLTALRFE